MAFWLNRLRRGDVWERILRERLAEPLHLNALSLFVALFGSYRARIQFDLVLRQQHAFGLLVAADSARDNGFDTVTAIEMGVANGAGLMNICRIAARITEMTGVKFRIYGFDGGKGLPPPRDYRDHPEYFAEGDFPLQDHAKLANALPSFAKLIIGDISETVPRFVESLDERAPLGFVSIDVDYYWSAKEALNIFSGAAAGYLPRVVLYLDDIAQDGHCRWAGPLLAVEEFNAEHSHRKIGPFNHLRNKRLFKRASWIDHMFSVHVFDHARRAIRTRKPVILDSPIISNR